ncbi:unnamed protein product [Paramecium sonneborni]|uniref:Uncharacterized protein n=1 Tax=Paramecium sonneborni TaxID=65129 RepID=A0A8S1ML91_9CILI|nr:unnamed protein product [Paramecium sonneborni]
MVGCTIATSTHIKIIGYRSRNILNLTKYISAKQDNFINFCKNNGLSDSNYFDLQYIRTIIYMQQNLVLMNLMVQFTQRIPQQIRDYLINSMLSVNFPNNRSQKELREIFHIIQIKLTIICKENQFNQFQCRKQINKQNINIKKERKFLKIYFNNQNFKLIFYQ